jgi:hypothetical protein
MKLMKSLLCMSMMLLLSIGMLHAQTPGSSTTEIVVGTGTGQNGTTGAGPINIWYKSMHYQAYYSAAELTAAGLLPGAAIEQMGWEVVGAPNSSLPNFTIAMGHTTGDGAVSNSGLTTVYNTASYTPAAGGFDMLTLSTPFVWNGTDDLVIDNCFDPVPNYHGSGVVKLGSANGLQSRYQRSDIASNCGSIVPTTQNTKPVVKLVFSGGGSSCEEPLARCDIFTVQLDGDGTASVTPGDIGSTSTAECGLASEELSKTDFDCTNLGPNTVVYTITDVNGASDSCAALVMVEKSSGLPGEWVASDIGDQGTGSDYVSDPCMSDSGNGTDFTITTGAYNLIPQNADNLAFAKVPLCGNGGIQARIDNVEGGYAGLIFRESSAPGSKMFAVYSNMSSLLRRDVRLTTNGPRTTSNVFAHYPSWLRIVRQGNLVRAFYRMDQDNSWMLFQQVYLPMPDCMEMGIVVFSTDPFGEAAADFKNVRYLSLGNQGLSVPNVTNWISEQPEVLKAEILPNPVRSSFTLRLNHAVATDGRATLFNEFGQSVAQQPLVGGETILKWESEHLPVGIYFMEIVTENGYREVLKVIRK